MKMKLKHIIAGVLLSIPVFASGYYPEPLPEDQPWSIIASAGNGKYQNSYSRDDVATFARLALGNELMLTGDFAWGLELGLQNGQKMRLTIPSQTLAVLEWLPVKTSLGPMLDFLVTAKSDPLIGSPVFAQIKGGVAYRYWQIENNTINNLSQIAGEIQAGFGCAITGLASLNLLYQGVYGNNPSFSVSATNKSVHLYNIPSLHALLVGLTVNL